MEDQVKKVNSALTAVFIVSSVLFVSIYFPISYQNCNETINRVDSYVENTTCFCENNVGFDPNIITKMLSSTPWGKALNGTGLGEVTYYNGTRINVNIYPIIRWIKYYHSHYFTNKIIKLEIDTLSFNDPYELFQPGEKKMLCIINYIDDKLYKEYNTTEDCIDNIRKPFPDFEPILTLDFNNEFYQNVCGDISYCEVHFCPTNSIVNIVLFCGSIVTSMYTLVRVLKYLFRITYEKYKKNKNEKIEMKYSENYQAV